MSGEDEEYMVIRVDAARHVADVIRMSGVRRVGEGVSLRALRPLREEKSNRLALLTELNKKD